MKMTHTGRLGARCKKKGGYWVETEEMLGGEHQTKSLWVSSGLGNAMQCVFENICSNNLDLYSIFGINFPQTVI